MEESHSTNVKPQNALIEVCFSPALLNAYHVTDKVVVVIDVFRASSAICTALGYGLSAIIPVASIDEALNYKNKGYITAAERNGEVVAGFDFGNSPFAFQQESLIGREVVLTTSNCTKAIHRVQQVEADTVMIGSFINMSALADKLAAMNKDVVLLCAGWKSHVSLEDSLCAGAIAAELLQRGMRSIDDGTTMSMELYESAKGNLREYLYRSSHHKRLGHLNLGHDLEYCLVPNQWNVVPVLSGHRLIPG